MAEESAAPSTSADKTESMDADGEAKKLLGLGQKNLVMGDIPAAVNAFQEAASLLGKTYGETANECAEAFFFYGKALLELARVENGVLGNALEGVQVEEEEEKAEEKAEDAMVESADNIDETEGSEDDDKAGEDRENDSTVEEKESEDDVGNLELAWDMLELAKVIYKRQDTKEAQLHAAQAHLKLGEVSIESENYTQAIEEFHSCLTLQQKYLEAHDRLLAESYYHLGLAYHYNSQFDEAVLYYSKSVEVIDKRMVMLNERLKADGSIEDESEYVELEELLPEIQEKIEDSKESQKNARAAGLALKATLVGGGSSSSFSQGTESSLASTMPVGQTADGASKCITDISHLVRKKRKPEEETQQGDNEAKKSKPEPAVNGGGDAAPSGNEIAEKMEEETEERPQVETVQTAV